MRDHATPSADRYIFLEYHCLDSDASFPQACKDQEFQFYKACAHSKWLLQLFLRRWRPWIVIYSQELNPKNTRTAFLLFVMIFFKAVFFIQWSGLGERARAAFDSAHLQTLLQKIRVIKGLG